MTVYNKLVRDRIPEIIRANGGVPVTRVLDEAEFREALRAKLREEVEEYLESPNVEELADISEVLRALAALEGATWTEVDQVRTVKARERGTFSTRMLLETAS